MSSAMNVGAMELGMDTTPSKWLPPTRKDSALTTRMPMSTEPVTFR